MVISYNSISKRVKQKAFLNWLKEYEQAINICRTQNVSVYDLYKNVTFPKTEAVERSLFLIQFMSNLEVQNLTPQSFKSVTQPNGVVMGTVLNIPIIDIYKQFYEVKYVEEIISKNLGRDVYIK